MISVLYPMMAMLKNKMNKNRPKQASLVGRDATACCNNFHAWMEKFKAEAAVAETNKRPKAMKMKKKAAKSTKATKKKKGGVKKVATGRNVKKTKLKTNSRISRRRARYQYHFLSSSSSN